MKSFNFGLEIHSFKRSNAPIYFLLSTPRCPAVKGAFFELPLNQDAQILLSLISFSLLCPFTQFKCARAGLTLALPVLRFSNPNPSDSDVVCHLLFVEYSSDSMRKCDRISRLFCHTALRCFKVTVSHTRFGLTKMTFRL